MVFRRKTMNLAFYVNSTGKQNSEVFEALNKAVEDKDITDASIFYNDIDYNPVKPKFGMFNSTDIWTFTGVLVATTLENTLRALSVVNKFKLMYLYNKDDNNLIGLLHASNHVSVITKNEEDSKEVYRLTGKIAPVIPNLSVKKILEVA